LRTAASSSRNGLCATSLQICHLISFLSFLVERFCTTRNSLRRRRGYTIPTIARSSILPRHRQDPPQASISPLPIRHPPRLLLIPHSAPPLALHTHPLADFEFLLFLCLPVCIIRLSSPSHDRGCSPVVGNVSRLLLEPTNSLDDVIFIAGEINCRILPVILLLDPTRPSKFFPGSCDPLSPLQPLRVSGSPML